MLGLQPGTSSVAEVQRRYRQLAAAVHPDKCSLPGAAAAFQKLQQGMLRLLSGPAKVLGAKRRHCGEEGGAPSEPGAESGEDAAAADFDWEAVSEEDEEWLASDNGGFPWWGEWDPPAASAAAAAAGAGQEQDAAGGQSSSQPAVVRQEGTGGSGAADKAAAGEQPPAAAAGLPMAATGAEEDVRQLRAMGIEELRIEVLRRQEAQLSRRDLPLQELAARLRWAAILLCSAVLPTLCPTVLAQEHFSTALAAL